MDDEKKEIDAVHERDLENFLRQLGILDQFEKGDFKCKFCKTVMTRANIHSVMPESGAFNFVCDSPACVIAFSEYVAEKNKKRIE